MSLGRDRARRGARWACKGRAREPRRCAGRRLGRAGGAGAPVVRSAGRARPHRRADAGDAGRSRGPAPLSQRLGDARAAARGGAVPVVNENDQRRDRGNPLRRQRPAGRARRAGGGRARRCCCCPTSTAFTTAIRARPERRLVERVDGVTPKSSRWRAATRPPAWGRAAWRPSWRRRGSPSGRASRSPSSMARATLAARARASRRASARCSSPSAAEARARHGSAGGCAPAGVLTVDAGCAAALAGGASLLAAGMTEVEGEFARGDLVGVHGAKGDRAGAGAGRIFGRGMPRDHGPQQDEQAERLGYAPRAAVIHRDHMVLSVTLAVTGATGFVGQALLDEAARQGLAVRALTRATAAAARRGRMGRGRRSTMRRRSPGWPRARARCSTSPALTNATHPNAVRGGQCRGHGRCHRRLQAGRGRAVRVRLLALRARAGPVGLWRIEGAGRGAGGQPAGSTGPSCARRRSMARATRTCSSCSARRNGGWCRCRPRGAYR